jgi:hypothetical protein
VAKADVRVTVNQVRRFLYLLGDIQATGTGRVDKRIARRAVGRATGTGTG